MAIFRRLSHRLGAAFAGPAVLTLVAVGLAYDPSSTSTPAEGPERPDRPRPTRALPAEAPDEAAPIVSWVKQTRLEDTWIKTLIGRLGSRAG